VTVSRRKLSSLAHVELLTPDLGASVAFAHDMLGMHVVGEQDGSAFLRCWGDEYRHSLVLTSSDAPGLGHAAWRTEGPEELDEVVAAVPGGEWVDGSFGHGRAYRFEGPGGQTHEVLWDVERAVAPPGEESPYPGRVQRASEHGIGVRMLDHVTVTTPDVRSSVEWNRDHLGFRIMAGVEPAEGAPWVFSVVTTNEKSHDLGYIMDFEGQRGRLHHVAFWVETNHDLTQGATFLVEHGADIDFGPGQHGIGEQNYLYFRDPVGLRYELNSGGYRNYVPDFEPIVWRPEHGSNNTYRTEIGMPAVHMANIPPGVVGRTGAMADTQGDSAQAALARS
jgi:catechol 2,3-dioxygenase